MASSSTIQTCLSLTHNGFPCTANIRIHAEMNSVSEITKANIRFNRGHALLRKQVQKTIVLHPQKTLKRRFTFPGNQEQGKIIFKKRRRFTSVALPTKFLLGGNINDPLNLRSLDDDETNPQLTPASSPMPISRHRTQVQVLIPPNIYDPLNLNTGEEIEFNLFTSKQRKRRRHRKNRREDGDIDEFQELSTNVESSEILSAPEDICLPNKADESPEREMTLDIQPVLQSNHSEDKVFSDKIVSPAVPQGSPVKFFKRNHSRSFSKDTEEKSPQKPVAKRRRSKTRFRHHVDYMKFRANAKKFCYGNHIIKWNINSIDVRLNLFNKHFFYGKDIMDIGCNSGELTLYIAKHWKPNKIIGVDIDKKLVNIAQRKVRTFKSKKVTNIEFPQSMAACYGSLAKFGVFNLKSPTFPNNVAFFEANYVPGSEEYLDTQKPEFDVLLCLRLTKWIHLNFGDDGLKLAFKRMYAQLKFGGYLILEPQPWFTYSTSKRITPSMYKTYCELKMRPDMFCEFLLSEEVGFSACELIGRIYNCTKVYRQPLYLFTKGYRTSCRRNIRMDLLAPIPFHSDQWNLNCDELGRCRTWSDADFWSSYSRFTHPDMD